MGEKIKKSRIIKCIIKTVAFMLIFVILLGYASRVMTVDTSKREYTLMRSIYDEENKNLDAVYIGSSNCYVFWNSLLGWKEYGLNVLAYACDSQPLIVAEYMIREARKTHPDALYIVNINTLGANGITDATMHRILDCMPMSANKLKLTKWMTELSDLSFSESLEYYFPLIRYHGRWNELTAGNFTNRSEKYKNSSVLNTYLTRITDLSKSYKSTDEIGEINETVENSLDSLLDYCEEEKVKILFTTVPQAKSLTILKRYNAVNKIIENRGFDTLNLIDLIDEMGIDTSTDFYNDKHTNIHGSFKFTHYLSQYLIDNYGFTDKRGNKEFESWNVSLKNYEKKVAGYVLDFEWSGKRNLDLQTPLKLKAKKSGKDITISWQEVKGADMYAIYRRTNGKGAWQHIGDTNGTSFNYTNTKKDIKHTYTVVPLTKKDGDKLYGDFSYKGVTVKF